MVALKLVCALVTCMLVVAPMAHAAITCGQVTSSLTPCIQFLMSGGSVPAACCNGIKSLNSPASTPPDRQQACKCLQNAAKSVSGIDPNLASGFAGQCGVNIPYKISISTNCADVK